MKLSNRGLNKEPKPKHMRKYIDTETQMLAHRNPIETQRGSHYMYSKVTYKVKK